MSASTVEVGPGARGGPTARPELGIGVAEGAFIHRSLLQSLRDTESLLMAVMLPVVLMLMFTFVFGGAIDPTGGYLDYVVPGIILTCAGFGAASTAVGVNRDMTTGLMERLRTMPIGGTAVLAGHVVASVLRNLAATAVVVGVAVAIGFRPVTSPLAWLGVLGVVTLWILAITAVFAAIGLAASTPEAASGYGFALLFLPYLSSAFVPVSTMPGWLQPVAGHQPVTRVVDTVRALLLGGDAGSTGGDGLWSVAWCALLLGVAAAWGAWLWRRAGRG